MRDHHPVTPLNANTVGRLPATVGVPDYPRDATTVGIVHIGVGKFHRAHQAMYLDHLLNRGERPTGPSAAWACCRPTPGCGTRCAARTCGTRSSSAARTAPRPPGRSPPSPISSTRPMTRKRSSSGSLDPGTRIVSLTITEGGYSVTTAGGFDAGDPAVADLEPGAGPRPPCSVSSRPGRPPGRGIAPFTIVSCDNLPGNGRGAAELHRYARLSRSRAGGLDRGREVAFPTAWWTGSPRSPPTRPGVTVAQAFRVDDPGRSSARASPRGCSKTGSPWAGRRTRRRACRSRTSRRTSR